MPRPVETPATTPARRPRNRSERQVAESAELKASIVRAASTAFAERGYAQTTLDAVARLVGLTRPGILHHFSSKDALFRAVLEQEKVWAEGQIRKPHRTGPLAEIYALEVFLGGPAESRTPLRLIHVLEGEALSGNEAAAQYVAERAGYVRLEITSRLETCRDRGELPGSADVPALAALIAATINGLQKLWLIDAKLDPRKPFRLFVDTLAVEQ